MVQMDIVTIASAVDAGKLACQPSRYPLVFTVMEAGVVACLPEVARVGLSEEEFEALCTRARGRVWRVLRALTRDADAADSLTQDCLLRAYRARASFRGDASPETWLLSIAINLARDRQRSPRFAFWRGLVRPDPEGGSSLEERPGEEPSPERRLQARETVERVWQALATLSPQQREVFVLRHQEELSLEEIAGTLGLALGTVKVHLFRATRALREALGRPR